MELCVQLGKLLRLLNETIQSANLKNREVELSDIRGGNVEVLSVPVLELVLRVTSARSSTRWQRDQKKQVTRRHERGSKVCSKGRRSFNGLQKEGPTGEKMSNNG